GAAEPVVRDADRVVRAPRDDRQREPEGDPAGRREAEPGDQLEEVPDQDEEEEGCEERDEPVGVGPEHGDRDLLANELHAELHHRLKLARHDGGLPESEVEEQDHDPEGEDHQERDEVEAEAETEELDTAAPAPIDEVLRARRLERCREDGDVQRLVPWNYYYVHGHSISRASPHIKRNNI